MQTLNSSIAGQFGFGYDSLSRRTSLTRPNGVATSYSYDQLSRLLSALHQVAGSTIDGASYTYDNAGNRLTKTNYQDSSVEQYAYDPLYQLTQVTRNGTVAESYSYDKVGNRLSSATVATYSYNSSNQLTSSSDGLSYTYDNNGNTIGKTDASGTTQYAWDYENRLTSVNLAGGGAVTFKYDPFGRRIQVSGPSGTTNYVYDGANVAAEVDNTGVAIAQYAQDLGIDEPLVMQRSGALSFYSSDGLGSITSLTTSSGALADTFRYDTFGNVPSSTGNIVNPYRYTGREYDTDSGFYYFRSRYYDPASRRFLSEDPIRSGMNFYAYVSNSPINLIDPLGLSGENPVVSWWSGLKRNGNFAWNWLWETDDFGDAEHVQLKGKDYLYYGPNTAETQDMMNSAGGLYMQLLYRYAYHCKGSTENHLFPTWAGYLFTTYNPSNTAFQVGAFSFDITDMGDDTVLYTMYNKAGWYSLTGGLNLGMGDHDRQPNVPMHMANQFGGNVRQIFKWRGPKPCGCGGTE